MASFRVDESVIPVISKDGHGLVWSWGVPTCIFSHPGAFVGAFGVHDDPSLGHKVCFWEVYFFPTGSLQYVPRIPGDIRNLLSKPSDRRTPHPTADELPQNVGDRHVPHGENTCTVPSSGGTSEMKAFSLGQTTKQLSEAKKLLWMRRRRLMGPQVDWF